MNVGKTIIAPLIAFIVLTLKMFFNIDLGGGLQAQITDWVSTGFALGFVLYGIFKSHKRKHKE